MSKDKKTLNAGQIAIVMVVLTATSKVIGLVRELLFAHFYGAGTIIDAYCMAQDIPDTVFAAIIQLVGTAFLPIYSRKVERESKAEADKFTSQVYNFLLSAVTVMVLLCILFPGFFLSLFAPGFSQEALDLSKYYLRIAVFMLFGHVSITIFEPYLRYNGSYLAPVIFGFFQSLFVIVFTFISAISMPEYLIFGVPLGAILHGLGLIWYARRTKAYHYSPSLRYGESVKEVFALSFPILLSSAAGRLNVFFDRMIASGFEAGSISALRYGHLILNLISAFSYALIGTITYPKLTKLAAQKDYKGLSKLTVESLDYTSMLTIPLMLGSMAFSVPLVRLIYERGAFNGSDTVLTASVFFWYVAGLVFNGIGVIVGDVFYALKDIRPTVFCSLATVFLNAVLNFTLSSFMGVQGLALATTIAAFAHTIMLLLVLRKRHKDKGIRVFTSFKTTLMILLCSVLAVGAAYIVFRLLGDTLLHFLISVAIAIVVYFVLMLGLKVVDPALVMSVIKKRKE